MKRSLLLLVFAAIAQTHAWAATYTYAGPAYGAAELHNFSACPPGSGSCGAYTTAMAQTGSFTTAGPLPANLSNQDITALVTSFSFSDGLTTYASGDPQVMLISVAGTTTGGVLDFSVKFQRWQTPAPHVAGDHLDQVLVTEGGQHNAVCAAVSGVICGSANAGGVFSSTSDKSATDGTWTAGDLNQPPVALPDTYDTPFNTALSVAASGVLVNDSDPDGDPITAVLSTGPTHGSLTLNANGSFVYTPTTGYSGPDGFSYFANDGTVNSTSGSSGATVVSITVNAAVNHAPVANNDTYNTPVSTALTVAAGGVLSNDSDPDGNTLTALLNVSPTHGSLTLNANGSFVYIPTADYNGPDSFSYFANDGALNSASAATVNISVGTTTPTGAIANVPTLSEWALALLSLMVAGFAMLVTGRKR